MKIEDAIKELKECWQDYAYAKDEAFKTAIEALEKQIPKEPIMENWAYKCPVCDREFESVDNNYCEWCGQALKWEVTP